jgi:hypothetical protein
MKRGAHTVRAARNVSPKGNAVSTIVRAAAVQISPVLYSRQGTVGKIVKKIRRGPSSSCDHAPPT